MKSHLRVERAWMWLGGSAAFGIVAAHCLAYVLTAPETSEMSLFMDATGHRYWGLAMGIALGIAIGGAVGFHVRDFHARPNIDRFNLFMFTAPRLAGLQLVGFVLLEVSERTFWGTTMTHPLEEPVVLAGLALQIVVALVSALTLSLIARLVIFVTNYLKRTTRAPMALSEFDRAPMLSPRVLRLAGGTGARGPPLS